MTRTKINKTKLTNSKPKSNHIKGGKADKKPDTAFNKEQLEKGIKVEMEHTNNPAIAKEIAKDHLKEDPQYYTKLEKIEGETKCQPR